LLFTIYFGIYELGFTIYARMDATSLQQAKVVDEKEKSLNAVRFMHWKAEYAAPSGAWVPKL
jgi:hypothetical protein